MKALLQDMGPKERAAMAESIGTSTGLETAILLQHDVHRDAHPSRSYTIDYIHYPRGTCKSICTYLHATHIYIYTQAGICIPIL